MAPSEAIKHVFHELCQKDAALVQSMRRVKHLLRKHVNRIHWQNVTHRYGGIVTKVVDETDSLNQKELFEMLREQVPESAHVALKQLIHREVREKVKHSLTELQEQELRQMVDDHRHGAIPDKLGPFSQEVNNKLGIKVPHSVLVWYLRSQSMKHARSRVTQEHKHIIRKRIMEANNTDASVDSICLGLSKELDGVPPALIRVLVLEQMRLGHNRALTKEQRRIARCHVDQSPHKHDISMLCGELKVILDIPNEKALHKVVQSRSVYWGKREIHPNDKRIIAQHSRECTDSNSLIALCRELRPKLEGEISDAVLYALVDDFSHSVNLKKITDAQRQRVKQHVAQSEHADKISVLCDELVEMDTSLKQISRRALYLLVRSVSLSVLNGRLTADQVATVEQLVLKRGTEATRLDHHSALCDQLEQKEALENVPRYVLAELVNRFSKKLQRQMNGKKKRPPVK